MTKARKESALHLALIVLIQFISLAVVILNATVLYLLRNSPQNGIVKLSSSPADYILLILGSLSFIASTSFLFLHLHLYFRISDERPFTPPKGLSATEVITSVISIALWTVASSVILTLSQKSTSPCKLSTLPKVQTDTCELFDTTLMLAFSAVGGWVMVLLATLVTLIRSPIPPTTIFTIEAPPQRFSHPMMISAPNKAHISSSQQPRPYYINHNKISPTYHEKETVVSSRSFLEGTNSSTHASTSTRYMMEYASNDSKQDMSTSYYNSCYQPRYVAISSPSNNNSSTSNNTTSSYYSTRCQLPYNENQLSNQSLSTVESRYTGFAPLEINLPVIQVGALSHIDVSFIQKRQ